MRRLALVFALALLLVAPSLAAAQFQYGPGGGIVVSTNEVDASDQTATAQSLIPSSIQTTQTAFCYTQHCKLVVEGILGTAPSSAGTLTVTFSYGGISTTCGGARTLETTLTQVPFRLVASVAPDSTIASGSSGNITGKAIDCEWSYVPSNTAGTTPIFQRAVTTGTISNTATQAMVATATFTDTTKGTGIIARRQWFGVGN